MLIPLQLEGGMNEVLQNFTKIFLSKYINMVLLIKIVFNIIANLTKSRVAIFFRHSPYIYF